jgi:Flp pilus assembly protein TadG
MRHRSARPQIDVGEAEIGEVTVEAVIAMPLLLLLIFAIAQTSFNWYGRAALDGAAQDALSALQTNSTGLGEFRDAEQVARASLAQNANFVVFQGPVESTLLSNGRVRVTVRGKVPAPFPGASQVISASVVGTLDSFRSQGVPRA